MIKLGKMALLDSTVRNAMGDPLHSQPAAVVYGGTAADPDLIVYMATNDGYLHAINPIDGNCIDEDVFGNSRWDTGNEARNIGAVQLTLAPHLAVDATGDGTVDLGWNRPVDGLGDKVKGYVVRSRHSSQFSLL